MTYVDKIRASYDRQTKEIQARQLAQITRGHLAALAAQATRASEIGAQHLGESPILLDLVASALYEISVFGDAEAAIARLEKGIDKRERWLR